MGDEEKEREGVGQGEVVNNFWEPAADQRAFPDQV
jgi:hypothetical protein